MHSVLFVCTGNTCRSAMAAAMAAGMCAGRAGDWWVESAGLRAARGAPAAAEARAVLARLGIDLSRHRAKALEDAAPELFALALVMTAAQREDVLARFPGLAGRVFLLAEMAGESAEIADPFGEDEAAYARTAAQIDDLLARGWERIAQLSLCE